MAKMAFTAFITLVVAVVLAAAATAVFYEAPDPVTNQNYPYGLWVSVGRACVGEEIHYKVFSATGPAAHAEAAIYSVGGARRLVAEVDSDASGQGTFAPKPEGRYEIVAKMFNRKEGRVMFEVARCQVNANAPGNQANPLARKPDTVVSSFMQNYFDGTSRQFEIYRPGEIGAEKYTKVTIIYRPSSRVEGKAIREIVPKTIASNKYMVGFESAYPSYLNDTVPVAAAWKLGSLRAWEEVRITYVVQREITSAMVYDFAAPAIIDAAELPLAAVGKDQKSSAPKPPQTSGNEAALLPSEMPDVPLIAVGVLFIAAIAAIGTVLLGQKK